MGDSDVPTTKPERPDVTVYWRPGCVFCSGLLFRLDRSDIVYRKVNIWEDEAGAAFVRSVARGNETVPTVKVGNRALVNPSFSHLKNAVGGTATEKPRRRLFGRG